MLAAAGEAGSERWAATTKEAAPTGEPIDLSRLGGLWRGAITDDYGEAAVIGTVALALQAIDTVKGKVMWQGPPQSLRFEVNYRSFLMTGGLNAKYEGTVTLAPAGPRQTQARVDVKLSSSSLVPVIAIDAVCTMLLAVMSGPMGAMMLLLGLGVTAYQVWALSSNISRDLTDKVQRAISETAFGAPAVAPIVPPAGVRPPMPTPAPVPAPEPSPAPAPAPDPVPAPAPNVVEQLRQLGELRALGVVTDAEFEAKKAELLKRL